MQGQQHKLDQYYGYYQQQGFQQTLHAPDYSRQPTSLSMSSQGSDFRHDISRTDAHHLHNQSPGFSSHFVPGSNIHAQRHEEMTGYAVPARI